MIKENLKVNRLLDMQIKYYTQHTSSYRAHIKAKYRTIYNSDKLFTAKSNKYNDIEEMAAVS